MEKKRGLGILLLAIGLYLILSNVAVTGNAIGNISRGTSGLIGIFLFTAGMIILAKLSKVNRVSK